ncbi:MAG TPA: hypothetical protein VLC08_11495 [Chitinolyticbacter sp.]|nr:hypothetical protein [Chitinolyticbacter sp.]
MILRQHLAILGVLLLIPGFVLAGETTLKPGLYMTEGGWGELRIAAQPAGPLTFQLTTTGANDGLCDLSGRIIDGQAIAQLDLATQPTSPVCMVSFKRMGAAIEVSAPDDDACRSFCGNAVSFTGEYAPLPIGCDTTTIEQQRAHFHREYARRAYVSALGILQPLLLRCQRFLEPITEGWIRNDLALAHYHRHRLAQCLQLLRPLRLDAADIEESVSGTRGDYRMRYAKMLEATAYNLALCGKKQNAAH